MDYTVPVLWIVGIAGVVGFWKLIRCFNYELNFKESLLFSVSVLILMILCLTDTKYLDVDIDKYSGVIHYGIMFYFLALLVMYYIMRSVRLKKYIPKKVILTYLAMSGMGFVILAALMKESPSYIDGWDGLGLMIMYVMFCVMLVGMLMFINIVLYFVHAARQDKADWKNVNYSFSKISYLNGLMVFVMIGCVYGIDYFNGVNYGKFLERQKVVVMRYLEEKYPGDEFEITKMYEAGENCFMFSCSTPVIRNEVVNKTTGEDLQVSVRIRDLTVYK